MPEYEVRAKFPAGLDATVRAYLECAEWCALDENSREFLETNWDAEIVWSPESIETATKVCADFTQANAKDIAASGLSPADVGHNLQLTQNRHGAGFWDRGLGAIGDRLTANAHPYGETYVELYTTPGDDEHGTLVLIY